MSTAIEWCTATWNVTAGCTPVSPGCAHCWAARLLSRNLPHMPRGLTTGDPPRFNGKVRLLNDRLDQPLRWRKPRVVFVCSQSDLFHSSVQDAFLNRVFLSMQNAPQHQFVLLTKRPERMAKLATDERPVLPNVWLGVSIEDQRTADERLPRLLALARAGWNTVISAEPLLGPIDLSRAAPCGYYCNPGTDGSGHYDHPFATCQGQTHSGGIDWLIVGGESGAKGRPCDVAWIRSLVQQGQAAGIPTYVKQLGADCGCTGPGEWFKGRSNRSADECGYTGVRRLRDRKGGDPSEWPKDLRVREYPPDLAAIARGCE